MTTRRIVSVARDQGSIQAIAPVLRALQATGDFDVQPLAFDPDARPYVELELRPGRIDISAFDADPRAFTHDILLRWKPDIVLLGSSVPKGPAPNTPEQYMTAACRDAGVPTVAVLDAWGYYTERFAALPDTGSRFIPDVICALDRTCSDELRGAGVPGSNIVVTHNPWLDRVVGSHSRSLVDRTDGMLRALFVSQPLAENRRYRNWPYTQHQLFQHVVAALRRVREQRPVQLVVWLHPSEDNDEWERHLAAAPDLAPEMCHQRGPAMYANVDVLITSHSTLVYEALHLDVPCVHLRPGDPPWARSLADAVGLTSTVTNEDELTTMLLRIDENTRSALRSMRLRLSEQGIFFSDGHATDRVVAAIYSALQQQALE